MQTDHMGSPIATLSMYDWPETRTALETFWDKIAVEFEKIGIPAHAPLAAVEDQMPLWRSPDLLIGQTCGWPYANFLRGDVLPFARFDFDLPDCPPGTYRSVYIGRNEDDRKYIENAEALAACPKVAMNSDDSQSGLQVFSEISKKPAIETIPPTNRIVTGAHRNSIMEVAAGNAHIAAIDAVAFELAKRYEKEATDKVAIIGYSMPKPGLPLITSHQYADRLDDMFHAVSKAVSALNREDRDTLCIKDCLRACDEDYDVFLAA